MMVGITTEHQVDGLGKFWIARLGPDRSDIRRPSGDHFLEDRINGSFLGIDRIDRSSCPDRLGQMPGKIASAGPQVCNARSSRDGQLFNDSLWFLPDVPRGIIQTVI